ncbi:hypothetical protein MHYP_G00299300 [Metynnis hypsauchen]
MRAEWTTVDVMTALSPIHGELCHAARHPLVTMTLHPNGDCLEFLKKQRLGAVQKNAGMVPVVISDCEEQGRTERGTITSELPKPKARPSHLRDLQGSTVTLPEEKPQASCLQQKEACSSA